VVFDILHLHNSTIALPFLQHFL